MNSDSTKTVFEKAGAGIVVMDSEGRWLEANPCFLRMLGYEMGELYQLTGADISHPDDRGMTMAKLVDLAAGNDDCIRVEKRYLHKDGHTVWLEVAVTPLRDESGTTNAFIGVCSDITGRRRRDEETNRLLGEKELLLKEVHHRIKNNMTTITSLLSIQSGGLRDQAAREIIREARSRIQSMVLLYDKLYQSARIGIIDLGSYVSDLVTDISLAYSLEAGTIEVRQDIEPVQADARIALPVGIIVNELVTNIFKYAFPDGRRGVAGVTMREVVPGRVRIVIRDDGIGLADTVDPVNPESFGLRLVNMLVKQLRGELAFERAGGSLFTVAFPV